MYLKKFPDFPKIWNEARQKALKDLQRSLRNTTNSSPS
ncbi:hypothetical protein KNP414_04277 [Paenibacillus mucilaginosus KNP414]|uniref:Uncharacterized protein n=1 Tax=Paenibacillus mucilaginosus (strain KNP414) TaxID=1036673 RepID=F8FHV2_PAEMK|nr:hypothetical protein KNP414_04277 [Paenibacillus mucilaginosus KNP414]